MSFSPTSWRYVVCDSFLLRRSLLVNCAASASVLISRLQALFRTVADISLTGRLMPVNEQAMARSSRSMNSLSSGSISFSSSTSRVRFLRSSPPRIAHASMRKLPRRRVSEWVSLSICGSHSSTSSSDLVHNWCARSSSFPLVAPIYLHCFFPSAAWTSTSVSYVDGPRALGTIASRSDIALVSRSLTQ